MCFADVRHRRGDGMYHMAEPNDAKRFYPVNTVTIKVSAEFFIDDSNLEKPGINYYLKIFC